MAGRPARSRTARRGIGCAVGAVAPQRCSVSQTDQRAVARPQRADREHSGGAEHPARQQLPGVLDRTRAQKRAPREDVDARVGIACPCAWIPGAASSMDSSRSRSARATYPSFAQRWSDIRREAGIRASPRMPIVVSASTVRPGAHAVIASLSARRLIVVSSNQRCTWLLRVVYRRP